MGIERVFLADDEATAALGARLAAGLRPGELVLLQGDLGVGKTTLARALIRTLAGDPNLEVPSPSFALVQPYAMAGGLVLHVDLYRVSDPREVDELALFDRPEAIVIVEWPERDPELMGGKSVMVTLTIPADHKGRIAEISR